MGAYGLVVSDTVRDAADVVGSGEPEIVQRLPLSRCGVANDGWAS
jgi:hypothetical protein